MTHNLLHYSSASRSSLLFESPSHKSVPVPYHLGCTECISSDAMVQFPFGRDGSHMICKKRDWKSKTEECGERNTRIHSQTTDDDALNLND